MSELTKYTVTSSIGVSMRCGLNHVIIEHGTEMIKAADVEARDKEIMAFLALIVSTGNDITDGYMVPEAARLLKELSPQETAHDQST